MKKPTGRAPLLSDDEFKELLGDDWIAAKGDRAESAGKKIRDFYEAKIASGELMARGSYPEGPWPVDVSPLLRGDVKALRVPMVKDGRIHEVDITLK